MTQVNDQADQQPAAQAEHITMSSGGLYSLATKGAKHVIDAATPLVLNAIAELPADTLRQGITMADLGCADGGTSLSMVSAAIDALRARDPSSDIAMVYADQPRNDFNALVSIVHGLTDFSSYLEHKDGVFPLFSGTSFYRQALPSNTLHVGFSATAMHWLSSKPCDINDHVHMVGANATELARFAAQAQRDWQQILLCRARELVSGGRLILVNFCQDEQGYYLGNTGAVNMFDTFRDIWLELLAEQRINASEFAAMTLPQYYNGVDEFCAPLQDESNPCYQAGLRLEHIETRVTPCPFAEEFKQHGDAKRFADGYIPTIRSWNESTFFAALDASRPLQERQQLISDYYQRYHQRVMADPVGHAMDYVHAFMVISKQ